MIKEKIPNYPVDTTSLLGMKRFLDRSDLFFPYRSREYWTPRTTLSVAVQQICCNSLMNSSQAKLPRASRLHVRTWQGRTPDRSSRESQIGAADARQEQRVGQGSLAEDSQGPRPEGEVMLRYPVKLTR